MVDPPRKKVGLIACSGEELPCGTLSRVAVRQVLESLRPEDTVTLCLPLFLAGNEQERAFARFYPTIAVDGCDKQCAKRATERYSAKVAGEIVVDKMLQEQAIPVDPQWRRQLDQAGQQAAQHIAESIAAEVDQILGHEHPSPTTHVADEQQEAVPAQATCSCAGGIPVTEIRIGQETVSIVALDPLLTLVHEQAPARNDSLGAKLLQAIRIYNEVPAGAEREYEEALLREYNQRFGHKEA